MQVGDAMLLIASAIEREYLAEDWKRFVPAQFITSELPEEDVLRSLKGLVDLGKLNDEAFLRCPDGHVAWHGSPKDVRKGLEVFCRSCEQLAEADQGVELQFTISKAWADDLDQLRRQLKKKISGMEEGRDPSPRQPRS